jgi:DNA (cytosine-5)-methyltransferase 1
MEKKMKEKLENNIKFIDLFAGIGGFHLALKELGAECVFSSEIDPYARQTYLKNFPKANLHGDITKIKPSQIPDFDILCAGFPCQSFSSLGKRKGFEDKKDDKGNMFFHILNIIREKKPKAFFLENVKGLLNHEKGRTFFIIKKFLENEGYSFHYKLVKASDFGIPQLRPRVFMIGFRGEETKNSKFEFPEKQEGLDYTLSDVMGGKCKREVSLTLRTGGVGTRRYYGWGTDWFIYECDGKDRVLTTDEGKRLMNFPKEFEIVGTKTQKWKQIGNSVVVKPIREHAKHIIDYIKLAKI